MNNLDFLIEISSMSKEDFEKLRDRLNNIMPDYMKEFKEETLLREKPQLFLLSKKDFITNWIDLIQPSLRILTPSMHEYFIKELLEYRNDQLEFAFNWINDHYAELDLGGNSKDFACLLKILELKSNKLWNEESERKLIEENIVDTRWFDF